MSSIKKLRIRKFMASTSAAPRGCIVPCAPVWYHDPMRLSPSIKLFVPPLVLSALLSCGLQHLWYRAFGMWAAGVRPLTGRWFGLDFLLLAAALVPLFRYGGERLRRALPWLMAGALVVSQAAFTVFAWKDFAGQIPWSSDQPSFLFRLHEVRATFPRLGGYNPWWNGGTEHFISVTSGTHGYAVLVAPLLALFEPHVFHAPVLFFWIWIGFPWLGALSVRASGARWTSAIAAAMMLEAYCRAQYLFGWRYGILGGLVTAGLATPLAALGYRLVVQRRGGAGTVVAVGVLAWLNCLWTPGYATCAGLALGALANADRWTRRSFLRMGAAAVIALVLLAPWAWATLGPAHGIVDFASGAKELPWFNTLCHGLLLVVYRLLEWHPALVAFGVAGLALAGPPRLRRWALPTLAVLFGVLIYSKWNVRSQCYRVIFQGAAFAAFPASVLCGRLLERKPARSAASSSRCGAGLLAASKAATLAALLLGLRISGIHALNIGAGIPYNAAEPSLMRFVEWIKANVPEDGRLAFAGETENHVGGGTVAYLPILTGREMMADDYYTFPAGLISRNFPPREYRESLDAFLAYSRLYGITHWVVIGNDARKLGFYRGTPGRGGRPGAFDEVGKFKLRGGTVRVFAVRDASPGRFLVGAGVVEARENRILVHPADPSADLLVLRYNWREGLVCRTPGASIEPYEADKNLRFIAVRPNGAAEIDIGYRAGFRPLAPNFDGAYHH